MVNAGSAGHKKVNLDDVISGFKVKLSGLKEINSNDDNKMEVNGGTASASDFRDVLRKFSQKTETTNNTSTMKKKSKESAGETVEAVKIVNGKEEISLSFDAERHQESEILRKLSIRGARKNAAKEGIDQPAVITENPASAASPLKVEPTVTTESRPPASAASTTSTDEIALRIKAKLT